MIVTVRVMYPFIYLFLFFIFIFVLLSPIKRFVISCDTCHERLLPVTLYHMTMFILYYEPIKFNNFKKFFKNSKKIRNI